ncbi:MAG: DUF4920 domain-containing protein [Cyclobacteriaceae bacterium]|nr:DUF4920 domain-containing protein [Cyclobacteriaceae bacterium]
MKRLFFSLLLILVAVLAYGQPPKSPTTPGSVYGATINAAGAVEVAQLPGLIGEKPEIDVKITAKVIDVCSKKGCWVALEMPDESKVFVKMKDYGFFVPLELIGKTVVLDGVAKKIVTSVDELKHYAEDAKKPKEEIDAITEPKEEIRFTANGILVVK